MKSLIVLILSTFLAFNVAYCGEVMVEGQLIKYNDEWSFKILMNQYALDIPDGIVIYRSSFYWEQPDSKPFRDDMRGVTFVNCNLDNLIIPNGNTVIGGSQRKFKAQADGEDWIVNDQKQPLEPLNKERFIAEGKSIDPSVLINADHNVDEPIEP